ncbi:50S ribosomal protein L11 methyltransferase [Rubrivirga sp. IMCC45206]|uniref:50S ribosomal protein L11 methyltransferase n=1 Tax=Rubrivirga sp. IMCC45206 TaxID=3391614 RepID=UPI00398FB700
MQFSQTLAYHASMLLDTERTLQFQRAIHAAVTEGDIVVDIGCGTGVLAFFACQAGAQHVYAIERGPIVGLARELAAANGFADRVTVLHDPSWEVDVPEPVDVVVSETLWDFGLGEGIVDTIADASLRWLRPGGLVIPASFEMLLAPAGLARRARPPAGFGDAYGLDLSRLTNAVVHSVGTVEDASTRLLGEMTRVGGLALPYEGPEAIVLGGRLVVERAGFLDALAGSFRARLFGKVFISNVPPNEAPNWGHAVFPIEPPVRVEPGDLVEVEVVTSAHDDSTWRWSTRVTRDGTTVAESRQSTQEGLLAAAD